MNNRNPSIGDASIVTQLDRLIELAEQVGFRIRYDYFGGTGGGVCEFGGSRWLFIDLALSSHDRHEVVRGALINEPLLSSFDLTAEEQSWIGIQPQRRAA